MSLALLLVGHIIVIVVVILHPSIDEESNPLLLIQTDQPEQRTKEGRQKGGKSYSIMTQFAASTYAKTTELS